MCWIVWCAAHMRGPSAVRTVWAAEGVWRLALVALIIAYAYLAGALALHRHASLETQALDMGYADQIAWNASQGRLFRFTVFTGEAGLAFGRDFGHELAHAPGADRESLLAFHVELMYVPLSLLYRFWPGPETLVVLLTAVLALGAVPAYWIARRQLGHPAAALAFAVLYLGMPAIQGANVSDFHPVSMAGPLLLLALCFLLEGRTVAYVATAFVCLSLKEEVGLTVAMTGLYAWVRLGKRRLGAFVFCASLVWVLVCVGLIIPHHTGGAASPFLPRYADALKHITSFPAALLDGRPAWPVPDHAIRYVAHMLASCGLLAVLAPAELAITAPMLAVNALSSSNWQHGGGAHYSSEVAGPMLVAAICGARRVASLVARGTRATSAVSNAGPQARLPAVVPLLAAALSLVVAAGQSAAEGVLPPASRFMWPRQQDRLLRLEPLLARIRQDAVVSAQSNLFPHVSQRERVYVFPTVDDAEYVLLDVAGTSAPLGPDSLYEHVQKLLLNDQFELLAAEDGFLLFSRGREDAARLPQQQLGESVRGKDLSQRPSFLTFAVGPGSGKFEEARASFDALLDLVGYSITPLPGVNLSERRATVVLYFRARQSIDQPYRIVPFLTGADGTVREYDVGNSAQLWLPTNRWKVGEVMRLRYPPVAYLHGQTLAVGVTTGDRLLGVAGTQSPELPSLRGGSRDRLPAGVVHVAALP